MSSISPRVEPWGPKDAKIVLVGEAPGETEEKEGRPFVGSSGQELRRMLREANIDPESIRYTNVFKVRPPNNKLDAWCLDKKELPQGYSMPPLYTSPRQRFVAPQYLEHVTNLHRELATYSPNLVILAGGVSLWAFGGTSISQSRGVITRVEAEGREFKALPIYHPSAILQNWSLRTITMCDLTKAHAECAFPEIRRPERELWIEPTLGEVITFFETHLAKCSEVSIDIETHPKAGITCIALAPSAQLALCIPLWDPRKPDQSYWTFADECVIWRRLRGLLHKRVSLRQVRTIGQNLLYDVQHLAKAGLKIPFIDDDTMLMHHAIFPESQKGLGFLGSIYTNELSWKGMAKEGWKDK